MLKRIQPNNRHACNHRRFSLFSPFQHPVARTTKDAFIHTTNAPANIDKQTSPTSLLSHNRDLHKILDVAKQAALQAGGIMKATSGKIATKSKANAADLVTASDVECQEVIKSVIMERFPQDFFLGEEDVDAGSVASVNALETVLSKSIAQSNDDQENKESQAECLVWIVDPIDGTTNFQAGLPMFCASIGVLSPKTKEILVGVIYNPVLNEMTTAIQNEGCHLNGKPVQFSNSSKSSPSLSQSVINIGFPVVQKSTLLVSSRAITALCTEVRGIRMIACASQVMAWVAQGKLQAYISWDLNAWDVAAGMLIVKEAGGDIYDMERGKTNAGVEARDMVVTNSEGLAMRDELLHILKENDCVSY